MHASRAGCIRRSSFGDGRVHLSGERVSNTWVTYPQVGDNPPNGGLIPHVASLSHGGEVKGGVWRKPRCRLGMGPRPIR